MKWLQLLIGRKIIIGLLCVFIVMVGAFSINKLDAELTPDITFDMAVVNIYAGEMPALDVEEYITTTTKQPVGQMLYDGQQLPLLLTLIMSYKRQRI